VCCSSVWWCLDWNTKKEELLCWSQSVFLPLKCGSLDWCWVAEYKTNSKREGCGTTPNPNQLLFVARCFQGLEVVNEEGKWEREREKRESEQRKKGRNMEKSLVRLVSFCFFQVSVKVKNCMDDDDTAGAAAAMMGSGKLLLVGWFVDWMNIDLLGCVSFPYKSSSPSSGNATWFAVSNSFCHWATCCASIVVSAGSKAGACVKEQFGSPVNLRVMYRKGFSKL